MADSNNNEPKGCYQKTIAGLLSLVGLTVAVGKCSKEYESPEKNLKPVAEFKMSNQQIFEGQTVFLENISYNTDNIKWIFPDNQTSSYYKQSYTIDAQGTYTIKLQAFSKDGKQMDEARKTIYVLKNLNLRERDLIGNWQGNNAYFKHQPDNKHPYIFHSSLL